jgi:hypothetical protein
MSPVENPSSYSLQKGEAQLPGESTPAVKEVTLCHTLPNSFLEVNVKLKEMNAQK